MNLQNLGLHYGWVLILVFLLGIGCQQNEDDKAKHLLKEKIRGQILNSMDSNTWQTLFTKFYDSVNNEINSDQEKGRYWAVVSDEFLIENIPEEAEKALLQSVRYQKNTSGADSLIYELAEALDKFTDRKLIAKTYYKVLLDYYPQSDLVPAAKNNLPSDMKSLTGQIKDTEQIIRSNIDANKEISARLIKDYVTLSQLHANFVSSEASPGHLIKSAAVARGYGNTFTAKILYNQIITQFEDSPQAAKALFQKAFMLDQNQENISAEKLYQQFLNQYPEHVLVPQVKILLDEVYLTDEEILKKLERVEKD